MWGQKWGMMLWGRASAVPAIGLWGALLLGCLLGIVAVLVLRSARKTGLVAVLLILLVPLTAVASVPFIFTNGTIADASQINADFAAVIPLTGRVDVNSPLISGTAPQTFVFPSSVTFVAPRDLVCIVTVEPFVVAGTSSAIILWAPAIQIGSTQTGGGSAGPSASSVMAMPTVSPNDVNYTATFTDRFSVPSGSSVSFGAWFHPINSTVFTATVTAVYSCTPPP